MSFDGSRARVDAARRSGLLLAALDLIALLAGLLPGSPGARVLPFLVIAWFVNRLLRLQDAEAAPRRDTRLLLGFFALLASSGLVWLGARLGLPLDLPAPEGLALIWLVQQGGRELLRLMMLVRARPVRVLGEGPAARACARALRRQSCPRLRFAGYVRGSGQIDDATTIDPKKAERDELSLRRVWLVGAERLLEAEGPGDGQSAALKRLIDTSCVLATLGITLPLLASLLVLARLLQGPGPLHSQVRLTRGGRPFRIYKIRSMPLDAEPTGTPVWPARADARITPLGRVLRQLWLDELPQLWNVLRGELALVGPRPERPEFAQEIESYLPRYQLRHRSRAGMTGLAQVRGFVGNTSLRKRLLSDLHYVDHWSPWLDAAVLTRTFCQALKRDEREQFDFVPGDEGPIP